MQPQTVLVQVDFNTQDPNDHSLNLYEYITINPLEVLDTDIGGTAANEIVSGVPYGGAPVIQPVMTGQQVNLQATSAYGDTVSNVQWTFDYTDPTIVVSDYQLPLAIPSPITGAVGTPSPLQTTNPTSVYWLQGGQQHVHVTGVIQGTTYSNDVYYPITAANVSQGGATVSPSGVQVYANYPYPPCSGTLSYVLTLGNFCSNSFGITWTPFSVSVPSYGGGFIAMAQTGQTTISGTLNGKQTNTVSSLTRLDSVFPYAGAYATTDNSLTLQDGTALNDSPMQDLSASACTKFNRTDAYEDYFMYRPTPTSTRPSIWITLETLEWAWTGKASLQKGAWSLSQSTNPTLQWNSSTGQFPSWPQQTLKDAATPPSIYPC